MDKVKVGFIGSGYMGQLAHIANYAQLPDVEIVALAEGRARTAEAVARRYGIREVYPNHRELLENADVDAVVSIMGFDLFASIVPDILSAKKHCLTEKPICINAETGRRLEALARANGVVYQIGNMKRFDPGSRFMRRMVAEWRAGEELGRLKYLRVTMPTGDWVYGMEAPINLGDPQATYEGLVREQPPAWMDHETGRRYVAFINFYIHQVNLIRYLLGEDYEVEYADPTGVLLVARSASGVPIVLEMATYSLQNEWNETYVATFDKGWISLDLPAPMARQHSGNVTVYRQGHEGGKYEKPVIPPNWAMAEQAKGFIEAVRTGKPTLSPALDAVKDLEVSESYMRLMASYRAASA